MDESERRRRIAEMDARLAKTGTPVPHRTRLSTGRLFTVKQLAEAQLCVALGVDALPEPASKTFGRLMAEAETRCQQEYAGRIADLERERAELETRVNEMRAALDSQQRTASLAAFEATKRAEDDEQMIASLRRQLDAANVRARRGRE